MPTPGPFLGPPLACVLSWPVMCIPCGHTVCNAWMPKKSEKVCHNQFQSHYESANVIQTNRCKEFRPQHRFDGTGLPYRSVQDLSIENPAIQAELAEFWSHRAKARQEYRISKALREKPAMVPTAASKPASPEQRAAQTSQAPPPCGPVLAK